MTTRAVLLIDHGSQRKAAHEQLVQLGERLSGCFADNAETVLVKVAHMEIAEPSILQGFSDCVEQGATHIVAIPCLLSRGRHVTEDIPRLLSEAAAQHPDVSYEYSPPLVEIPGFVELLRAAALGGF